MIEATDCGQADSAAPMPWLNPYGSLAQNKIAGKFQSLLFYHEIVAPILRELHAINHILSYCAFGLSMAGDKNGDGKLELFEVREYIQDLCRMTDHDTCLIKGLHLLARNYADISGAKRYILEEDLLAREKALNLLLQESLFDNDQVLEHLVDCDLEELDLCVIRH